MRLLQRPFALAVTLTLVIVGCEPAGNPRTAGAAWLTAACGLSEEHIERIERGFVDGRSPDVTYVTRAILQRGGLTNGSHSGPWDFVQRVPLVLYGPGFIRPIGETEVRRKVTVADIAPTQAALLGTPFPPERAGRPLKEVLRRVDRPPRLVLTVVWDGVGMNVLKQWPHAWPTLRRVMRDGASIKQATLGSSPSNTPPIHATIGTGTYPREHGIADIVQRTRTGVREAFWRESPQELRLPTLADVYDRRMGNSPIVGMFAYLAWHLGMLGHGSQLSGADKDIAVLLQRTPLADEPPDPELHTNQRFYRLPAYVRESGRLQHYLREMDAGDGRVDSEWRGNDFLTNPHVTLWTPAWIRNQTAIVEDLIRKEGFGRDRIPDLFFTNFKQSDDLGHAWGMTSPEAREVLEGMDSALAELIRFLDERVGRTKWVLVLTADHGQEPLASMIGAWDFNEQNLRKDVVDHFDLGSALVEEDRPGALWLETNLLRDNGYDTDDVADFLTSYTLAQNRNGTELSPALTHREDQRLIEAAIPTANIELLSTCSKQDSGSQQPAG